MTIRELLNKYPEIIDYELTDFEGIGILEIAPYEEYVGYFVSFESGNACRLMKPRVIK